MGQFDFPFSRKCDSLTKNNNDVEEFLEEQGNEVHNSKRKTEFKERLKDLRFSAQFPL